MFKLQQKRKEEEARKQAEAVQMPGLAKQMSIRSRFLTQEVSELQGVLPKTCQLEFENVDDLRGFKVVISPDEGYWKGGRFVFEVSIPSELNIVLPITDCMDGTGWLPTRIHSLLIY